jgi:hypothetical protein
MKVFLWILREGGARDVPSFDALWDMQDQLRKQCGIPSTPHVSAKGNVFFQNDPLTLIAKVCDVCYISIYSKANTALGLCQPDDPRTSAFLSRNSGWDG